MTKEKSVQGSLVTKAKAKKTLIVVRVTADALGKHLSLSDENEGVMLEVPLERVKKLLETAEEMF